MSELFAVVTGTRKGIGRYITERLLDKGYTVFGCSRKETELKNDNYYHFQADVSDEASVKEMAKEVKKISGGIDVLINNAGIAAMNHSLLMPLSSVQKVVNTNLIGTFNVSSVFARLMKDRSGGARVVNFTTVAVALHLDGEAAYAASKAGVEELTRILSKEYAPYGILVNAIGPTPIDTDLIKNVGEERLQKLIERQSIKRLATTEEVWKIINFLIAPDQTMLTGQILYMGGVF